MKIADVALLGSVVLIPFQQALTISVGFPLKLSEILAVLGVGLIALEARARKRRNPAAPLLVLLGAFVLFSLVRAELTVESEAPPGYPLGLAVDGVVYSGYAALALALAYLLSIHMDIVRLARAYMLGLRLAAGYSAVQLGLWFAGSDILRVVNGATQTGTLYGTSLPRNGPFLEGNYFGFFAAAGLFIAMYAKDRVGLVLSGVLVLYSQSSGATLGVVAGLLVLVAFRPQVKTTSVVSFIVVVGIIAAATIPAVALYAQRQLIKVGLSQNTLNESLGYSIRSRSANAETGFAMGLANPFLGVGPGRYGSRYFEYLDRTGLPAGFGQRAIRPIANNVYAHIAAELGLVALFVFGLMLLVLLLRSYRRSAPIFGLVVFVAVAMIAAPAWTGLPIWIVLAVIMAASSSERSHVPTGPIRVVTKERGFRRSPTSAMGSLAYPGRPHQR
ncbi:O-antigen ligase family protein [Rathayibacter caricis]|uniref:O-antigen ligase family protein n=1 Tax=Rathayibacter caricis TaxID=110936 RepID=UPI001FB21CC0|nr:O-antigen ligase family protein [Rathayibacter caricis]MCJ1694923.1 O-antigen ligase family protein [Rathayibacter caricis]